MPHGMTWFNFLPGWEQLEAYARDQLGKSFVNQQMIEIQHVVAALLVIVVILALSIRARLSINAAKDGGVIPEAAPSIRNVLEVAAEALLKQMNSVIGPE